MQLESDQAGSNPPPGWVSAVLTKSRVSWQGDKSQKDKKRFAAIALTDSWNDRAWVFERVVHRRGKSKIGWGMSGDLAVHAGQMRVICETPRLPRRLFRSAAQLDDLFGQVVVKWWSIGEDSRAPLGTNAAVTQPTIVYDLQFATVITRQSNGQETVS